MSVRRWDEENVKSVYYEIRRRLATKNLRGMGSADVWRTVFRATRDAWGWDGAKRWWVGPVENTSRGRKVQLLFNDRYGSKVYFDVYLNDCVHGVVDMEEVMES